MKANKFHIFLVCLLLSVMAYYFKFNNDDVEKHVRKIFIRRINKTLGVSEVGVIDDVAGNSPVKMASKLATNEQSTKKAAVTAPNVSKPLLKEVLTTKQNLKECGRGRKLVGELLVNKEKITWEALKKEVNFIKDGGLYFPTDCKLEYKVAVIIPYRDREEHLKIFLRQILSMLKRQDILFQIFVIEQADKNDFNRGKLMNVGFREAMKFHDFNCFVFHDVDLIPENDHNYYGCAKSPAHMSVAVDKFNYKLLYATLFGGVEMFSKEHFMKINGFSNNFWSWGAEDDNLYQRVSRSGLSLKRPAIEVARYTMLKHKDAKRYDTRFKILKDAMVYANKDGLNSLQYEVLDTMKHSCYTKISVDLHKEKDKILTKR